MSKNSHVSDFMTCMWPCQQIWQVQSGHGAKTIDISVMFTTILSYLVLHKVFLTEHNGQLYSTHSDQCYMPIVHNVFHRRL